MSTEEPGESRPLDAVKGKLDEIQNRHGSRIRWHIGKHTAELAIAALSQEPARRSSKPKKRSRYKRKL